MLQKLYFRYGLLWRHRYVPITLSLAIAVITAGGFAWWHLYQSALEDAARVADVRRDEAMKSLLDCMNGRAIWTYDNGKRSAFGYGKTVVKCRGAEG